MLKEKEQQETPATRRHQNQINQLERCSNLLPGVGATYNQLLIEALAEALIHIETIQTNIASRYHYENDYPMPEAFGHVLKGKATLVYLKMMDDIRNELMKTLHTEERNW